MHRHGSDQSGGAPARVAIALGELDIGASHRPTQQRLRRRMHHAPATDRRNLARPADDSALAIYDGGFRNFVRRAISLGHERLLVPEGTIGAFMLRRFVMVYEHDVKGVRESRVESVRYRSMRASKIRTPTRSNPDTPPLKRTVLPCAHPVLLSRRLFHNCGSLKPNPPSTSLRGARYFRRARPLSS
jgi:hypothetical protein